MTAVIPVTGVPFKPLVPFGQYVTSQNIGAQSWSIVKNRSKDPTFDSEPLLPDS